MSALRYGVGAKQVELYRGSLPCRVLKGGKFACFTSEQADERVDASQGDVGKRQKSTV